MILKKDDSALDFVANNLCAGKVVVLPTDTIYGFSGRVPESEERIRHIKGRSEKKPFIQLIAAPEDVFQYAAQPISQKLLSLWPAPLTLVLKTKNGDRTAFRCPNDLWLRRLIAKVNVPIFSTSVNYAGAEAFFHIEDIVREFESRVSLIVDGGILQAAASTIIDISGEQPRLLRQGVISLDDFIV